MSYFKKTFHGLSWTMSLRMFMRGITVVRTAILARLLIPAQFGTFGVANLVLAFLEIFTETWVNIFLVQEKGDIDAYIDTAWLISIIRGVLVFLVVLICAPFVSLFFKNPDSLAVIYLISVVPLIRGFINPSSIKLQKNLLFGKEFGFKSVLFLVECLVSVLAALITKSASSLVWGMIAGALLEVLLSWKLFSPVPRVHFDNLRARKILGRGKWITVAGIFNYLYQNLDNIVVGRLLGKSSLGIYDIAYKVSSIPISEISDVFGRVTFPIYSQISSEKNRLKSAFLRTAFVQVVIAVASGIGVYLLAVPIVTIGFGPNWTAAIPVLKILSIYGIAKSISQTSLPLFLALKKQSFVTWVTLASILGLSVSIVPLVNSYGLIGAGIAAIIGSFLAVPVAVFLVVKTINEISP